MSGHALTAHNTALLRLSLQRMCRIMEQDPQLAAAQQSDADRAFVWETGSTGSMAFTAAAFERYADRPLVATRAAGQPYVSQSYKQVWQRAQALAAAFTAPRIANASAPIAGAGSMIGICGFASPDWLVSHLASQMVCATSVPLRSGMAQDELEYVVNLTEMDCIITNGSMLDTIQQVLPRCPSLRTVVVMDRSSQDATQCTRIEAAMHAFPSAINLEALEAAGAAIGLGSSPVLVHADSLRALLFTSGSTGRPKAAMFPESLFHHIVSLKREPCFDPIPLLTLAYLPLNHMAGIVTLYGAIGAGGALYFVQKADMSMFLDDVQTAQPTFIMLVPRIVELIWNQFRDACQQQGAMDDAAREAVMQRMRYSVLGARLAYATVGTAPLTAELRSFVTKLLQVPVVDHYGQTEACVISVDGYISSTYVSDFKLESVPDKGYTLQDRLYPRGALFIKSKLAIPGYYRNPEATRGLYDSDGFLCTGDIVEEQAPGLIVYVDRMHNVIKLSHGEFVPIAKLEDLFKSHCSFVSQIFLYGESSHSFLLAVVVPPMENARALLGWREAATRRRSRRSSWQTCSGRLQSVNFRAMRYPETSSWSLNHSGLLTTSSRVATSPRAPSSRPDTSRC